ncbi:MAG: hypothetical protein LVQ95_00045 [Candidatus Micrarchaeales archaeon]|nr:hypothetical protein [Candidatus Micrarchaeales archaeon]
MARTVDFKFNEPGHELAAGRRTAARPYFIVTQNSAAGDSYFRTLEKLNRVVIAVPDNPIAVKGTISVSVNGNHLLYSAPIEALEAKKTESFDVRPPIEAGNHLSVVIDCKESSGSEPYIVQLDLS